MATFIIATIAACNGDCSSNAVVVATEITHLAPIIDTIEVYEDKNEDGAFALSERAFVVQPAPSSKQKTLKLTFLRAVPRKPLVVPGLCEEPPCMEFLEFSSLVDPYPNSWVKSIQFDDGSNDVNGPMTMSVTYHLYDDLVYKLADIAIPVTVTLNLPALAEPGETLEKARFFFMLAKRVTDERIPPRITQVHPAPFPPLPGWGRAITMSDFLPGETLKDLDKLLARIDGQVAGFAVAQRPSPHGGISLEFDDPMVNLVVQVTPSPDRPGDPSDPKGIELISPTFGFLTPFEEASTDTSVGMAPDTLYRVEALSSVGTTYVPIMRGTQNESGEYLIPNFDDHFWDQLRRAGYTPDQLAGHTAFTFRTGPFRITGPEHKGNTNAETAPNGAYMAQLQFARPAEGIATPALVHVRVAPAGHQETTASFPFPTGSSDTIQQDGFVRSEDVSKHAVPIQLPDRDYDDTVELEMQVFSGTSLADYLSRDKITFHHDNIVPTVDANADVTNTLESDGVLDKVCFVADCDVTGFIVQGTNSPTPVMLSASEAQRSACDANNRQTFCFEGVSLGVASLETDTKIFVIAIDDQGNKSSPVVIDVRPRCQIFDKFVAPGGKLAAITTADGIPTLAWSIGSELVYAKANPDGSWPAQPALITSHEANQTFGLGIDLMLHPLDSEPVVCVVVAPEGLPSQTLGQLRVLKRTRVLPDIGTRSARIEPPGTVEQFEWRELARENDVRPLGCSLTTLGNTVVVGWSGIDAARLGFVLGNGVLGTQNLPLPPGLVRANNVVWDVDVAAGGATRVYFAYRTANPTWNHVIAPGSIVAGYIDGTVRIAQDLSARPQLPFPQPAHTGFGPRIIADEHGVGLAYISAVETAPFDFETTRALEVMGASHPMIGMPIVFGPRYTSSDPPPLGRLTADGVTRTSDGVAVPFGPPALVRGLGPEHRLVAGWPRGSSFQTEEVAVAAVDPQSGDATIAVLDRRVGTSGQRRTERIAVQMTEGKHGYFMTFRNPSVSSGGMLVFANEQDHPITLPTGSFACSQAWQTAFIYPDELMLKYQRADANEPDFFDSMCAGVPSLPRPFKPADAIGVFPEEIGARETLLDDVVAGIFIENGRGLLKHQTNVCVPESGIEACEPPTAPSNSGSTCASSRTRPDRLQPPPPSPTYRDETEGRRSCQDGQLMLSFDDVGAVYTCYRCPSGYVYDPSVRRCVTCSTGSVQYMPSGTVGQVPSTNDVRIVRELGLSVRCVSCDASDCAAGDPSQGIMDWIPTANGELCTRCAGGSQLIECVHDLQCNIFPNARCAAAGAPLAGKRVCVQACATHSDCPGGFCAADGYCADVNTQNEVPSGFNLLCRPIGCDECWQNSYCRTPNDCPAGHTCHIGEPTKSPACIARPLLSKQFEATLTQTIAAPGRPEDIANAQKAAGTIQLLRETVLRSLRKARLPWRFEKSVVSLTRLHPVGVRDIDLYASNGALILTVETSKIEVDGNVGDAGFSASTPGPVKLGFSFALNTGISGASSPPAENDSLSFSGLKLSALGVGAEGLEWDIPGPVDPDLSFFLNDLSQYLGPVIDDYVSRSFRVIGGLREGTTEILDQPDFLRCVFGRADPANPPFTHKAPAQCQSGAVPPIYNAAITDQGIEIHYPRCEVTP